MFPSFPFRSNPTEGANTPSNEPKENKGLFGFRRSTSAIPEHAPETPRPVHSSTSVAHRTLSLSSSHSQSLPSGSHNHTFTSSSGPSHPQSQNDNSSPFSHSVSHPTNGNPQSNAKGKGPRNMNMGILASFRRNLSETRSGPSYSRPSHETEAEVDIFNSRSTSTSDPSEQRNSSVASPSSPFHSSSSSSLDSQTRQIRSDLQALGYDLFMDNLSQDELNELGTYLAEISHQGEEIESPALPPAPTSTQLEKFQNLYAAVASTVHPHIPVAIPQELPENFSYEDSINDKGGHGGTKKATITYNGEIYHLFLKPKDKAEVRGYKLTAFFDRRRTEEALQRDIPIQNIPQVGQFMAKTYGVVRIDNREYFVMQDLTTNGNEPIMDVKPSQRIQGLFNPIASRDEIKHTERKKSLLDYLQMKAGTHMAEGYMIPDPSKYKRLFNFQHSQMAFKANLHANYTIDQIQQMRHQLQLAQEAIGDGEVVYIGSSFLFLRNGFYFIDPAHPYVHPKEQGNQALQAEFENDFSHIYFGSRKDDLRDRKIEFDMRKVSALASISLMLKHMQEVIDEKKSAALNTTLQTPVQGELLPPEPVHEDIDFPLDVTSHESYIDTGAILDTESYNR